MRSFLPVTILLFTASGALAQSTLTINTPVLPGSQPGAQAIEAFPETNGTSISWTVNLAAGTQIGLSLRDSTGNVAQSAPFTINPGPDSSCVGKPLSSGGASGTSVTFAVSSSSQSNSATSIFTSVTAPAATGSSGATTGASTGTTTGAITGAATGTTTPHVASGTGSTPATATHTNAASANAVKVGTAGLIGAALAALLA
ncbi:hypothetical protein AX14_009764 [Amanita brunnescens Koide BX004]|nr:hypothetical protein AX14_009764 [Amanita brunnescens Koide BX004]